MGDVIEVSYTGDLLAHRRCPRSWCYEKYAGFYPYEQVQAMEGRLIHHAMEWLSRTFRERKKHPNVTEFHDQLERFYRVLWSRGFRTAFSTKAEVLDRVEKNLFPGGKLDAIVKSERSSAPPADSVSTALNTKRISASPIIRISAWITSQKLTQAAQHEWHLPPLIPT